jgi:hypothetical protein
VCVYAYWMKDKNSGLFFICVFSVSSEEHLGYSAIYSPI